MKKIYLLISIILLTFLIFIIIILKSRNYSINYSINNFNIKEEYFKESGYYFTIKYKELDYPIYIDQKYTHKRKHLTNIILFEKEQEICFKVTIFNNNYYICSNNNKLTTLNNLSDKFLKEYNLQNNNSNLIKKYNNIEIYNNDLKILVWNYKGFYYLNKNNNNEVNIFKKDNYQNELTYQTNKYLIFPDYDSNYYFNKIYIYDILKNKINSITFDYEISYDSYYLGSVNNSVYFIDRKNNKEYELNLKKNSINIISNDNNAIYYNGDKWENQSINKLITDKIVFPQNNKYNFNLENNNLYININNSKILINTDVKSIINIQNDTIYYIINDTIYSYQYLKNNNILIKYPELNFNYNNQIFIFN